MASFDEGVLTLRFPRQGDVKGFQGSKYEDLLKQVLNTMFGVNVVIRAVTGGGDAPSPGRRPGQAPRPSAPAAPPAQPPLRPGLPPSSSGQPRVRYLSPRDATDPDSRRVDAGQAYPVGTRRRPGTAGPAVDAAGNGAGGGTHPFGSTVMSRRRPATAAAAPATG